MQLSWQPLHSQNSVVESFDQRVIRQRWRLLETPFEEYDAMRYESMTRLSDASMNSSHSARLAHS